MRSRKKLAPIAGAVTPQFGNLDELRARIEKVKDLWIKAGKAIPIPADEQLEDLALHISSCAAQPVDENKDKIDSDARAAIKTLLTWCRFDPNEGELPHLVFRNPRKVKLEMALMCAQSLADAPPSRGWVNGAWGVWRMVAIIMKARSDEAGCSAGSHAVRFTSSALQWVGYPAATTDAVSKELRGNPGYCKRVLE